MEFKNASSVADVCFQMRCADYTRGRNRSLIASLFNGVPPYTDDEVQENGIVVNVNFLESTRLAHDGRSQFANGFLKSGSFFNGKTDAGPKHSREKYNRIVTAEAAKVMKRSLPYFECMRSKFALLILHGISPAVWEDQDVWCPDARGVEDLLIPGNTYLTFKGLPMFALLKSFTAPELIKMVRRCKVDKGWNVPLVEQAIDAIDQEAMALLGTNFPEVWSPEKVQERTKSDGTFYTGDNVPTLDCYDFYYWSDEGKQAGWRRRIIVDDWSATVAGGKPVFQRNPQRKPLASQFLYTSESRPYAESREQIFGCQFADLSAVAPFRYHSVRSLGFLMYSICHLQNRMRCKFEESVFEALTMMFRVKSMDDVQRALKLELVNKGFIDDTISPVPAAERWQVNAGLVELGLRENQQLISDNSSSYTQNQNFSRDRVEKTRYQVMAEVNAMASLVSAGLTQAYRYQTFEYIEIFRRLCRPNSTDADVKRFQAACFRQGVPEKVLVPESWDIEPEQVFGGGNLTRETAIAEWLMQHYDRYEPQSQREILRKSTFSVTGDPGLADTLVPEKPQISSTVHDTELAFGTLMNAVWVDPSPGLNAVEAAGTTLKKMSERVGLILKAGGVGTSQDLIGLQLAAQYAQSFIQMLSQDANQKQTVRQLGDGLKTIMNQVKAFAQRQQEAAQKAAEAAAKSNGGMKPEDAAKIQATIITAQSKAELAKQSHAQRTAQRQVQFEMKQKQDAEKHAADLAKLDVEAAANIRRDRETEQPEGE